MSDLQISLLVVGVVVVGVVYLFNWVQERKLRRKLERAFGEEHEDVLLKSTVSPRPERKRVEPQLHGPADLPVALRGEAEGSSAVTEAVEAVMESGASAYAPPFDAAIDFIADIESDVVIPDAAVSELMSKITACGKPARLAAYNTAAGRWEDVGRGGGGRSGRLRAALQLVDRSGAVNAGQLASFCEAVQSCASRLSATASVPDPQAAVESARELDGFCADVDVAIGLNIVSSAGASFSGTAIRALAESAGFRLEPDGVFRYRERDSRTLFTLDNHEPAPFIPEQITGLTTTGVTLLLDVPRVAGGKEALDRMIEVGRNLAQGLGGKLVDDNRVVLSDPGVAKIRQQLSEIHANMEAHGIAAGSSRALRLFA